MAPVPPRDYWAAMTRHSRHARELGSGLVSAISLGSAARAPWKCRGQFTRSWWVSIGQITSTWIDECQSWNFRTKWRGPAMDSCMSTSLLGPDLLEVSRC